jgi:hypothetical protein
MNSSEPQTFQRSAAIWDTGEVVTAKLAVTGEHLTALGSHCGHR